MKAKIKTTGEIVEISTYERCHHAFLDTNGEIYDEDDLVIRGEEPIDWEQRRYEIAKDMLCAYDGYFDTTREAVDYSVKHADALIEALKKI